MVAPGPIRKAARSRTDWETPAELFDAVAAVLPFELDGAASPSNAKVAAFLSGPCSGEKGCGCGLCADWGRRVVWLNPPYGKGLAGWIAKCDRAARGGAAVAALLPASPDAPWFRRVWATASVVVFLSGRVNFVGSTSSNTMGSILPVWEPGGVLDTLNPDGSRTRAHPPEVRLWRWRHEPLEPFVWSGGRP